MEDRSITLEFPPLPLTPDEEEVRDSFIDGEGEAWQELAAMSKDLVAFTAKDPRTNLEHTHTMPADEAFARIPVFWDLKPFKLLVCIKGLRAQWLEQK